MVDEATLSPAMVAALMAAVVLAVVIGGIVALTVARRNAPATVLREA